MAIKFVKSSKLDLLSGAGLNLVGQIVERHTTLRRDLNRQFPKQSHGLGTGDVVKAYLLSLCTGKSDLARAFGPRGFAPAIGFADSALLAFGQWSRPCRGSTNT